MDAGCTQTSHRRLLHGAASGLAVTHRERPGRPMCEGQGGRISATRSLTVAAVSHLLGTGRRGVPSGREDGASATRSRRELSALLTSRELGTHARRRCGPLPTPRRPWALTRPRSVPASWRVQCARMCLPVSGGVFVISRSVAGAPAGTPAHRHRAALRSTPSSVQRSASRKRIHIRTPPGTRRQRMPNRTGARGPPSPSTPSPVLGEAGPRRAAACGRRTRASGARPDPGVLLRTWRVRSRSSQSECVRRRRVRRA